MHGAFPPQPINLHVVVDKAPVTTLLFLPLQLNKIENSKNIPFSETSSNNLVLTHLMILTCKIFLAILYPPVQNVLLC
jgi:hypothetical protein